LQRFETFEEGDEERVEQGANGCVLYSRSKTKREMGSQLNSAKNGIGEIAYIVKGDEGIHS